ncbi:MAG TPA: hypothetical protein VK249_19080 [Anaerolineales bacterium]|nr:hypothetical protein [Anaerolineales bacterium]
MPNILFVCTANLYRSPLAAAFFSRKLLLEGESSHWIVESAGTWAVPGQHVSLGLLKSASELDIDLQGHLTQQVNRNLLAGFDLVVVMEKGHREALGIEFPFIREKVHLLSELADHLEYDIADPENSGLNVEATAEEMRKLIDRAYPTICRLAQAREISRSRSGRHVNYTL